MKTSYPTASEAHPREPRIEERQIPLALLRAMQRAQRQGTLKITVPEPLRGRLVGKRHSFYKD